MNEPDPPDHPASGDSGPPGDGAAVDREEPRGQQANHYAGSETLREREARLRAILGSAVDGILSIDESGAIQSLNPAERLFPA